MSLLAAGLVVLHCTPALPQYCSNIHVGCAGRSRLETAAFSVNASDIVFTDGARWQIKSSTDDRAHVHRRVDSRDWVRIQHNGQFSLRIYRKGRALMTRGTCVQVPAATR